MIVWVFAVVTLIAAAAAALVDNMRRAALALWVAGLAAGGVYLTLGAETLAIIQWILSTLGAISFVFFAVMFGEYHPSKKRKIPPGTPLMERYDLLRILSAAVVGICLAVMIFLGSSNISEDLLKIPTEGNDLFALGRVLTQDHLLSLEVLAITLFLVMVGGGVIARPDKRPEKGDA